jgi:hypothetical protein
MSRPKPKGVACCQAARNRRPTANGTDRDLEPAAVLTPCLRHPGAITAVAPGLTTITFFEVKPLVEQFLATRGLELSQEKTNVTHIEAGMLTTSWLQGSRKSSWDHDLAHVVFIEVVAP